MSVFLFFGLVYVGGYYFIHKVQEDYQKLNGTHHFHYSSFYKDLYMLCMLDYHINPKGKDMLQECNKIAQKVVKKPDTPYYDFYKKYIMRLQQP